MSPRRSSRARTNPPSATPLNQSHSASSASSTRGDRTIRATVRQESSNKSDTPPLSSSDDSDIMDRAEPQARQTRQKKREQDSQDDTELTAAGEDVLDEDGEEEEITRCVCRRQDYPGPPIPLEEGSRSHKAKDHQNGVSLAALDGLPEDAGSLFIQCDTCKVWQHGGCVGIMDEAMSPDNYYCEECRNDLHKLMTGARGQKYSRYLPVFEASHPSNKAVAKSPPAKETDSRSSRDPEGKIAMAAAALSSAKRRSTMNSRAAMDEEEALRKAIEESKSDGSVVAGGSGSRKGKRGRDDSEDTKHDIKRRKTGSDPDSLHDDDMSIIAGESEDDGHGLTRTNSSLRKQRGAAAQVQREKELREREVEKERERAEAAGRRKGRAERRRADESEPPEEQARLGITPKVGHSSRSAKSHVTNKPPTSTPPSTNPSTSHKKNARPTTRRGRVGRNQYTKDRDPMADMKMDTPRASHSRDGDDTGQGAGDTHGGALLSNGSKPSRPRHMNPNRTSMTDLRKRAAGILEYITRTQVELATEATPSSNSSDTSGGTSTTLSAVRPPLGRNISVNGGSKLSKQMEGIEEGVEQAREGVKVDETTFKQLGSRAMMDILTRELVHWQKDFGKWGEK